jgi:hypothetical protein
MAAFRSWLGGGVRASPAPDRPPRDAGSCAHGPAAGRRARRRGGIRATITGAAVALVVLTPVATGTGAAAPAADRGGAAAARLELAHWGRFCGWYPRHALCLQLVILRRWCDRHPKHPLCRDHDDRFCRRHPHHPKCDDHPPSPS